MGRAADDVPVHLSTAFVGSDMSRFRTDLVDNSTYGVGSRAALLCSSPCRYAAFLFWKPAASSDRFQDRTLANERRKAGWDALRTETTVPTNMRRHDAWRQRTDALRARTSTLSGAAAASSVTCCIAFSFATLAHSRHRFSPSTMEHALHGPCSTFGVRDRHGGTSDAGLLRPAVLAALCAQRR
jgi:hypothetical protein